MLPERREFRRLCSNFPYALGIAPKQCEIGARSGIMRGAKVDSVMPGPATMTFALALLRTRSFARETESRFRRARDCHIGNGAKRAEAKTPE